MTAWPLEDGEALLWEGRPDPRLSLAPVRGTVTQLALVWGGLGLATALAMGFVEPELFGPTLLGAAALTGLIALAVALANRSRRRGEDYAVTDRRALIRYRKTPTHGRAFVPYDPDAIEIRPGPKPSVLVGRGPLTFGMEAGGTATTHQDYVLEMIDDGDMVADLLRTAARRNAPLRPEGQRFSASAQNWKT